MIDMDDKRLEAMADEYLFGSGLALSNFYIEKNSCQRGALFYK